MVGAPAALAHGGDRSRHPKPSEGCGLANGIKHVIYLQFDNTHLPPRPPERALRPRADAAPAELHAASNGTLTNDHTILISHTAGGILTSLTGLYPDRNGQTVSNSYRYFTPDGTTGLQRRVQVLDRPGRRPAGADDPLPNMVTDAAEDDAGAVGAVHPRRLRLRRGRAPRTPCSRTLGPDGDMTKVFGAGSPEWNEARLERGAGRHAPRQGADRLRRLRRPLRAGRRHLRRQRERASPTALPDEPGGYTGFKGLFGAKYVNPAITGGSPS